jgi:hypothetical protein
MSRRPAVPKPAIPIRTGSFADDAIVVYALNRPVDEVWEDARFSSSQRNMSRSLPVTTVANHFLIDKYFDIRGT